MHAAPGTSQQTAAPPAAPPAAAAATGPPQAGEGRKKKKLRAVSEAAAAAAAAAGDEDGQQGGITLFGGQQGAAAAVAAAAVVASFVDHEPRVQTGDPFEEANVIRKAHKIKASLGDSWTLLGAGATGLAPCRQNSPLLFMSAQLQVPLCRCRLHLRHAHRTWMPACLPAGVWYSAARPAAQLCRAGREAGQLQAPAEVGGSACSRYLFVVPCVLHVALACYALPRPA